MSVNICSLNFNAFSMKSRLGMSDNDLESTFYAAKVDFNTNPVDIVKQFSNSFTNTRPNQLRFFIRFKSCDHTLGKL